MSRTIIRLIGETDIVDIDPASHDGGAHPKLMGLDADDRVNLLGHWLDQDRGEALQDDPDFKSAMTAIGSQLAADQPGNGVNFVVITILRENGRWGQKQTFRQRPTGLVRRIPILCIAATRHILTILMMTLPGNNLKQRS